MAPPLFEPDAERLLALHFDLGWSYQTIADYYEVTKDGVFKRFKRMGVTEEGIDPFKEFCPWEVREEHRESRPRRMLRLYEHRERNLRNRRKPYAGMEQRYVSMLENWLHEMGPHRVVDYDPARKPNPASDKGGFFYRRRIQADGDGPIRRLEVGR